MEGVVCHQNETQCLETQLNQWLRFPWADQDWKVHRNGKKKLAGSGTQLALWFLRGLLLSFVNSEPGNRP